MDIVQNIAPDRAFAANGSRWPRERAKRANETRERWRSAGATLSIGEFSKLTHLSVKALRHYHDVGLLVPAAVDSESRYRRYDPAQARDAQLIRRLRALDMPIDSIRVVTRAADGAARDAAISEHLARMEGELARTQEVVASLRALLAEPQLDIGVERRRLDDLTALAIRADVSRPHVESWCGAAFGELWSAVARQRRRGDPGLAAACSRRRSSPTMTDRWSPTSR